MSSWRSNHLVHCWKKRAPCASPQDPLYHMSATGPRRRKGITRKRTDEVFPKHPKAPPLHAGQWVISRWTDLGRKKCPYQLLEQSFGSTAIWPLADRAGADHRWQPGPEVARKYMWRLCVGLPQGGQRGKQKSKLWKASARSGLNAVTVRRNPQRNLPCTYRTSCVRSCWVLNCWESLRCLTSLSLSLQTAFTSISASRSAWNDSRSLSRLIYRCLQYSCSGISDLLSQRST